MTGVHIGVHILKVTRFEQFDAADLPHRCSIRGKGDERVLVCSDSPTISVRIKPGMSVSAVAVGAGSHPSPAPIFSLG